MLGLNMYATAENGALSSAATLSVPDAGIISLRGKTWLTSKSIRQESSDSFTTFTPSTGGAGNVLSTPDVERAEEDATRERSRRRADGKMELNLLASLLGRAVQETEGKVSETGEEGGRSGSSSSGPQAFKMSLFAEDPFASAVVEDEYNDSGQKISGGGSGVMQTVHVEARSSRSTDVRDDINNWGDDMSSGAGGKRGDAGSKSAGGKTAGGKASGDGSESSSDDSGDDLLGLLDEAANHK
jgi:hypothetical protein